MSAKLKSRFIDKDKAPWKEARDYLLALAKESQESEEEFEGDEVDMADEGQSTMDPLIDETSVTVDKDLESLKAKLPDSDVCRFVFEVLSERKVSTSCMLVGPPGSGKTHTCDEIERTFGSAVDVIRPSLPFDLMGETVGGSEELLISLFVYAKQSTKPSILILDNIDLVCGELEKSSNVPSKFSSQAQTKPKRPHIELRMQCLLLHLLGQIDRMPGTTTVVICSAMEDWRLEVGRFERSFRFSTPKLEDRISLLLEFTTNAALEESAFPDSEIHEMVLSLAEYTSGLSYGEITQRSRNALVAAKTDGGGPVHFLTFLKSQIQQTVPDSLKTGANLDTIDMGIFTQKDLAEICGNPSGEDPWQIPLYGEQIQSAWDELKRSIIVPICFTKELNRMLHYKEPAPGKVFAGGVLLEGIPGCGKTALAYQCAAVASRLNPSIKLLDVSCTSLIHKEVGGSEQAIQRLFKSARNAAPCILIMDGIENIGAVRGNDNTTEGTMDRVVTTMLTELDGVDSEHFSDDHPACIAIIAITHDSKWIDPALKRAGRLDSVIRLGLPEFDARERIIERELRDVKIGSSDKLNEITSVVAKATDGLSGAEIVDICNEAKVVASQDRSEQPELDRPGELTADHFTTALRNKSGRRR